MDLRMHDSRAFVAGASSGLGRAIARQLLLEGCQVAICSRTTERVSSAKRWLMAETGCPAERVVAIACDVTKEEDIEAALSDASRQMGGLDLIVTNAGGPRTGQIDDLTAKDWRGGLELNLMSTINLSRAALQHLRAARQAGRHASILMISSLSAKQPIQSLYLSNVARAGVQGFAKSLSEELGAEGITVNSILPGYTRTDRLSHLSESLNERTGRPIEDIEAGWAANSALKRIGTEDEFAAAATFLLSPRAGFITGQALVVDGGAVKSLL